MQIVYCIIHNLCWGPHSLNSCFNYGNNVFSKLIWAFKNKHYVYIYIYTYVHTSPYHHHSAFIVPLSSSPRFHLRCHPPRYAMAVPPRMLPKKQEAFCMFAPVSWLPHLPDGVVRHINITNMEFWYIIKQNTECVGKCCILWNVFVYLLVWFVL